MFWKRSPYYVMIDGVDQSPPVRFRLKMVGAEIAGHARVVAKVTKAATLRDVVICHDTQGAIRRVWLDRIINVNPGDKLLLSLDIDASFAGEPSG
jgi:hypothetical protein